MQGLIPSPLSVAMVQFSRVIEARGGGREGLDANELSEKLATIPVDDSTDEGGETERPFISENSSTAAIFGSDGGMGPVREGCGLVGISPLLYAVIRLPLIPHDCLHVMRCDHC